VFEVATQSSTVLARYPETVIWFRAGATKGRAMPSVLHLTLAMPLGPPVAVTVTVCAALSTASGV